MFLIYSFITILLLDTKKASTKSRLLNDEKIRITAIINGDEDRIPVID
jgi:hypothetical protein